MKQHILRFAGDAAGVDLVEYALLAGLITLAAGAALTNIGSSVSSFLGGLETYLVTIVP